MDWISPALNTATTVANEVSSSRTKRKADEFAFALQMQKMEREAKQDELRERLTTAQIRNLDADNTRQSLAAAAAEADRKQKQKDYELLNGIVGERVEPRHTELGQTGWTGFQDAPISLTSQKSPPPPVSPSLATLGVKSRSATPIMFEVPEKTIQRHWDQTADRTLKLAKLRADETGENQATAAAARAAADAANDTRTHQNELEEIRERARLRPPPVPRESNSEPPEVKAAQRDFENVKALSDRAEKRLNELRDAQATALKAVASEEEAHRVQLTFGAQIKLAEADAIRLRREMSALATNITTRRSQPSGTGKRTITTDQAAFLKQRKGMTDAQINAAYVIGP